MATLTGQQINQSYEGLLKTNDNGQIGAIQNITDGNGNASVFSLGTTAASFSGDLSFTGLTSTQGFTYDASPVTGGVESRIQFGSTSQEVEYIGGTNMTITNTGNSITFTAAGGGGGSAGLVAGTGANSMQSSSALTTTAASAVGGSIAIGNGANASQTSSALGDSAEAVGNRTVSIGRATYVPGDFSVGIGGEGTTVSGDNSVGIGAFISATGANTTCLGGNTEATASNAVAIGYNSRINNTAHTNAVVIGTFNVSNASQFGGGVIIGGGGGSLPSNYQANDLIAIGRGQSFQGNGCNNTILAGLVATVNDANDAVGLGRQCYITGNGATSIGRNTRSSERNTAIGAFADADGGQSNVAIGQNSEAKAGSNRVAIGDSVIAGYDSTASFNALEVQDAAKGIIMTSPNGTKYRLTVSDAGVLSTAVA